MNKEKACICLLLFCASKRTIIRKRWVKDWIKRREHYSHVTLLREISVSDSTDYCNYFRMDIHTFHALKDMLEPLLRRQDTNMRAAISVEDKLAVTLRYLATGRSFEDLKFSALLGPRTISYAVMETCEALIYILKDYMKLPSCPEEWLSIAHQFGERNQFWNCLGSIDGKHVAVKKPAQSGSLYYNYKGFYSIVLLALVDANRKFIMIDVGTNGKVSDGGVLFYSTFGNLLLNKKLNLPKPTVLPNTSQTHNFVFVGDEAFALRPDLMKPYSQTYSDSASQEFNRRLSSARVSVENCFGILAARFGVFNKAMNLEPNKARLITMASCYLHNYLAARVTAYLQRDTQDGGANSQMIPLQASKSKNSNKCAKVVRDNLRDYFNNEGKRVYIYT